MDGKSSSLDLSLFGVKGREISREGEGELTMTIRGALIAAVLLCGLIEAGSARPVPQLGRRQGAVARGRATALLRQLGSQRFSPEEGGSPLRLRGGMSVYGTVTCPAHRPDAFLHIVQPVQPTLSPWIRHLACCLKFAKRAECGRKPLQRTDGCAKGAEGAKG